MAMDLLVELYPVYLTELVGHPDAPRFEHLQAPGYEPALYAMPGTENANLAPNATHEVRLSLPPESYVWAWSAYSQAEFRLQVTDAGTRTPFLSAPCPHKAVTGQGTIQGITFPLMLLDPPRLLIEPAVLTIQMTNLAPVANLIQFVLFCAVPRRLP